jgi:hypothetical protein
MIIGGLPVDLVKYVEASGASDKNWADPPLRS